MNVRPGTVEWLHFWGHEGDEATAKAIWERIQSVMKLDDKPFGPNDWKALVAMAQSREIGAAAWYVRASDRERMSIEATEESERLHRFLP